MSVSEHIWGNPPREVRQGGARDIGEHEGDVAGQTFGEDGGQGGKRIVCADSDAWGGAIGEDENGSNRVNVLLHVTHSPIHAVLLLLNAANVGQPRRVKDPDLRTKFCIPAMLKKNPVLTVMPFVLVYS